MSALEIKAPARTMVRRVVRAVERADAGERVIIQSFDLRVLRWVRNHDPDLPTAALSDLLPRRRDWWLDRVKRAGACSIGVRARDIERGLIEAAHSRGLTVRAWTVNDLFEAAWLWALGVDGMITDDPALLRNGLGEPIARRPVWSLSAHGS